MLKYRIDEEQQLEYRREELAHACARGKITQAALKASANLICWRGCGISWASRDCALFPAAVAAAGRTPRCPMRQCLTGSYQADDLQTMVSGCIYQGNLHGFYPYNRHISGVEENWK